MAIKRNPPKGNVRRVRSNGTNTRSTMTNKANRLIQVESALEKSLVLRLEYDKTVRDFESQPEVIEFSDKQGRKHTYVPDFRVYRNDGTTEIHEVSLTKVRLKPEIQARERAGQTVCEQRGWLYVVHSEATLPKGAELANMELLYGYRANVYANDIVADFVDDYLAPNTRLKLKDLLEIACRTLDMSPSIVSPTLLHMLWHSQLTTDFSSLLFVRGILASGAQVWIEGKK